MQVSPLTWLALAGGTLCVYLVCRLADRLRTPEQRANLVRRRTQGPYGVAGWLLVLVAILVVCNPVLSFIGTSHEISLNEQQNPGLVLTPEWRTFKVAAWLIYCAGSLLAIYAGAELMFRRQWTAVRRAIGVLWITGPILYIVEQVGLTLLLGNGQLSPAELAGAVLAPLLLAGVWTAYLLNSQRVRVTYRLRG